jgi:hypothetical protein
LSEAAERVVKRAIAQVLNDKGELEFAAIRDFVRDETGHGASRTKTCLSEMVGAGEVLKKPRRLPRKTRTSYVISDPGRKLLKNQ